MQMDAAEYTHCGDLKPDAPSCAERKYIFYSWSAAQARQKVKRFQIVSEADHLSANSWCPFLPRLLEPFLPDHNDILSESWSALGAVFSGTFIETMSHRPGRSQSGDRDAIDTEAEALRVPIPLGCMAPFTFYWKHRGKGDESTGKSGKGVPVPIHARPHDYNFCADPRKLPTVDTEATLEFKSACSNAAAPSDPGSQLQVLECLQTFKESGGHDERLPPYDEYFGDQQEFTGRIRAVCPSASV
jgi:hypothetical protein